MSIAVLGRYLDSRRPIDKEQFEKLREQGVDKRLFRESAIPKGIRGQLFKLSAQSIEQFEIRILASIDELLPANRKSNKEISDPLILGLCVRRLSLHYRRIMLRYQQFNGTSIPISALTIAKQSPF